MLSIFSFIIDVDVTFAPSRNIGVNQLAHYRCWSNHSEVSIKWFIDNGTGDWIPAHLFPGVVTNEKGTLNSSLTIFGYLQYNNSLVNCLASGLVDGNEYIKSINATLRIQGFLFTLFSLSLLAFYLIR